MFKVNDIVVYKPQSNKFVLQIISIENRVVSVGSYKSTLKKAYICVFPDGNRITVGITYLVKANFLQKLIYKIRKAYYAIN